MHPPLSAPGPKWAENSGHVRKEKLRLVASNEVALVDIVAFAVVVVVAVVVSC